MHFNLEFIDHTELESTGYSRATLIGFRPDLLPLTLSDNFFFFATPYQAPPNHGSEEYEFSDNPFGAIVVNLGLFLNRWVDLPQGEPYYDRLERVSTSAPVTAKQKSETFHPQVN